MALTGKHTELFTAFITELRKDDEDVLADEITLLYTERQIGTINAMLSDCQDVDDPGKQYVNLMLQMLQLAKTETEERLGRPAQANEEGAE